MKSVIMKARENRWIGYALPVVFLIIMVAIFSLATGGQFVAARNLISVVKQSLVVAAIATGAVFVFSTGNINLAMGSTAQLTITISMLLFMQMGYPIPLLVISSLAVGVIIMLISAILSTALKVRVMYVTLVMMILLSSIQNELISSTEKYLPYEITKTLQDSSMFYVLFIIYFVACVVLFNFTPMGRKLRFIGSNRICASYTGINTNKYLIIAFAIAGVGIGIGSIMSIIRTGYVSVDTCKGMNMDVILAIVLGGMPVSGGSKSKVESGLIGALTVTILNTGMLMVGISNTLIQGVRGVIFLVLIIMGSNKKS